MTDSLPKSVVVIGGGIVGLAIAERLSRRDIIVTVIEKESDWAEHQTGHNSGVIHAGPYYKPGSLKAKMCQAGNISMVEFAAEHGINHEVCGKLIVATSEVEVPRLLSLFERATANGVDSEMLSTIQAQEIEPNVAAVQALHVKATGIIDYRGVSRKLAELSAGNGAQLILDSQVRGIQAKPNSVVVEHDRGSVEADFLINAAGLYSDHIAKMAGIQPKIRIVPFRGEYYELLPERKALVRGLIYPVPDPALPFLGVHLTRGIDGSVHAGPNAVLAAGKQSYSWGQINLGELAKAATYPGFLRLASKNIGTGSREIIRSFSKRLFAHDLARLVPEITSADITRAGSGIRAQAVSRDGSLIDDFVIERTNRQVHVLNAPSPAATSALEIAKYIEQEVFETH